MVPPADEDARFAGQAAVRAQSDTPASGARRTVVQFGEFCIVGATGFAVNIAAFFALTSVGVVPEAAAICSFLLAVGSNYTWNRIWTFRDQRAGVVIQGGRFFTISVVALGANVALLNALITAGFDVLPAQTAAVLFATPINFVGNAMWSFSAPN